MKNGAARKRQRFPTSFSPDFLGVIKNTDWSVFLRCYEHPACSRKPGESTLLIL